ncbi:MAG TPA: 16S rRNA (adenine(1518)-N(6)/adenine(1519)-N(6))-dimethyltransferase RsmA [Candidatus Acidoferrales bacterium]|nr:16S rRNA (adenine(1518)-N(6)/adenine(1519)-N(6))-dimethyltransferase RsmA [Candidatus Acidoferrales bacterium]
MSRQKLGQHFLHSPAWRERIARTLPADANATWLEIGPGHGEMTQFLAQHSRRVIAIETDSALAGSLRRRAANLPAKADASAATAGWSNVEIVESDILAVDLSSLTRERFRVYGNLPYYITSPILSHLFRFAAHIDSIHIVIQWEVAARIAATPGHREYAYLSALCQYFTRPEIVLRIPPGAFRPPPKVNSALVAMNLPGERAQLGIRDDAAFLKFLRNCFSQKRKTLRNNLKGIFCDEEIAGALSFGKLMPKSRAEELSLAQFAQLYRLLTPEK